MDLLAKGIVKLLKEEALLECEYKSCMTTSLPIQVKIMEQMPSFISQDIIFIHLPVLELLKVGSLKNSFIDRIVKTIILDLGNSYETKVENQIITIVKEKNI